MAFVFYFGFNTIHGWNRNPESVFELCTDIATLIALVQWGRHKVVLDVLDKLGKESTNDH